MDRFRHFGQRGQTIVEFAIVLPLFMLILMGILQFGMAFADYSTLENVARSSARAAALGTSAKDVRASAVSKKPHIFIYEWDPSQTADFTIDIPEKDSSGNLTSKDVTVTINAKLDNASFITYVMNTIGSNRDHFAIHIDYKMYYEAGQ